MNVLLILPMIVLTFAIILMGHISVTATVDICCWLIPQHAKVNHLYFINILAILMHNRYR